jgi:hypothetical protein
VAGGRETSTTVEIALLGWPKRRSLIVPDLELSDRPAHQWQVAVCRGKKAPKMSIPLGRVEIVALDLDALAARNLVS